MIPAKGYAAQSAESPLAPWQFERRELGAHDVQIEIPYCGVCHTITPTPPMQASEVAYYLGFEYPQSFNKLFKNKTGLSPSEFRARFN